jgi:hypothetical protein
MAEQKVFEILHAVRDDVAKKLMQIRILEQGNPQPILRPRGGPVSTLQIDREKISEVKGSITRLKEEALENIYTLTGGPDTPTHPALQKTAEDFLKTLQKQIEILPAEEKNRIKAEAQKELNTSSRQEKAPESRQENKFEKGKFTKEFNEKAEPEI